MSLQTPVRLGAFNEPEPDVSLFRLPAKRDTGKLPRPEDVFLLIEVSDSTLRYDRTEKAALYARHGIAEYWIVDVNAGAIILHREPTANGCAAVREAAPGEVLEPLLLPGLRLAVADILA